MKTETEQVLCRFQLANAIRHGPSALYEWIVETAHREGLQGATVLTGFYGFGADGSVLQEHSWAISQILPVIVEVVDVPVRIEALLKKVEPVFTEGVITLERAHVLVYRPPSVRQPTASRREIVDFDSHQAWIALRQRAFRDPSDKRRLGLGVRGWRAST